jgi:Ca-activated chloride channel family protein
MESDNAKGTLHLSLETDYNTLPEKVCAHVYLVAEIRAVAENKEAKRVPLSVIFVLDVSGSMAGPPLEHVIESVDHLVEFLEPSDRVGVVAFSDNAEEVVPLKLAEGESKRLVRRSVHRMQSRGSTNIEAGLRKAMAMFPLRQAAERQVVLLLSDGRPNVGASSISALAAVARAMRPNISISSLGYGTDHDQEILSGISEVGAGNYHLISKPAACGVEFAQALGSQGDVVAENVTLCLSPCPGVDVTRFLGSIAPSFSSTGLAIPLPDLRNGADRLLVAELSVNPSNMGDSRNLVKGTLRYQKVGSSEVVTLEQTASIQLAEAAAIGLPEVYHKVLLVRSNEVRAEARALADRGQFEGAAAVLRQALQTMDKAPGFVRGSDTPLAEVYEMLVDEAMAMDRKPKQEEYKAFRASQGRTMTLSTPSSFDDESSRSTGMTMTIDAHDLAAMQSKKRQGPASKFFVESMAGKFPKAFVEIVGSKNDGQQFLLQVNQTIGRTASAEVRLNDSSVSRQHAQIFAQEGKFYLVDCGSTNITKVNGERVYDVYQLVQGDIIQLGFVHLRYKEITS